MDGRLGYYIINPPGGLFPTYDEDGNLIRIDVAGDMNCDGRVNGLDIDPFVLALTDPNSYVSQYPDCDIMQADLNNDGSVNELDVRCFNARSTLASRLCSSEQEGG